MMEQKPNAYILFDWGDTLMHDNMNFSPAMKDWPVVEAIPGAAEILPMLHSHWTLAIATNADVSLEQDVRAALQRVNLNQWLDKIYCSKTIGYTKPSIEFFRHIVNDLNLPLNPYSWLVIISNLMYQERIVAAFAWSGLTP
jgi:putative hydrolase of the HAD superfamily